MWLADIMFVALYFIHIDDVDEMEIKRAWHLKVELASHLSKMCPRSCCCKFYILFCDCQLTAYLICLCVLSFWSILSVIS